MNPVKQRLHARETGDGRKTPARGRHRALVPAFAALALTALLLNLGLTQFTVKAYLAQDGYAVPQERLTALLRSGGTEPLALLPVDLGETVYVRTAASRGYYIGEEKAGVSAGYPLFTQSGQVLYFLDGGLKLVTRDWDVLDTYEGLYLSDGVTFNADRSQADIQEVSLVQVESGYQVARTAVLSSAGRDGVIPMNAVCVFKEDGVLFYAYENGVLTGNTLSAAAGTSITIGDARWDYLDFLKRLGLWEEKVRKEAEETPAEDAETPAKPRPDAPQAPLPPEAPEKNTPEPKEHPSGSRVPQQPSQNTEAPGAAIPNTDSTPGGGGGGGTVDPNPGYQDPVVSFSGGLRPWVYTLSVQATVSDPARVLDGGVQVCVYEVLENGRESQALRRLISASGTVTLGQLRPGTTYHVTASYSYHDKLNYPQSKTVEVGTAATEPFDSLGPISLSFYDENTAAPGAAPTEIFPKSLQLRDLELPGIRRGVSTEVGGVETHPETDPLRAETYINAVDLSLTAGDGAAVALKMDAAALRLLREGYTLSHWETPERLRSGTEYAYTLSMQDRYGNVFLLDGVTAGDGHTCKESPTVDIRVPADTNVSGSTEIQVTWKNPDHAAVSPNDTGAMGPGVPAALFLVEQGAVAAPENAVTLEAHPAGQPGDRVREKFLPVTVNSDGSVTTVETGWVVTNLQVLKTYTAAVLCGRFSVEDNRSHTDEVLEKTADFLTASLSNLGTISYTAEADQVTHNSARLRFYMNSADSRLLALLDQVAFTLRQGGGDGAPQSFTLSREDLSKVSLPAPAAPDENGVYTAAVTVPLRLNGREGLESAPLTLEWKDALPVLADGSEPKNAWEFLLATSGTAPGDGCRLNLTLGGPLDGEAGTLPAALLDLSPQTAYVGDFTTRANQGGVTQDVTSGSSRSVRFTTLSEEALVSFGNAFVSTDFIELYDLSVSDPDGCILPDEADRDGSNVLIRVLDAGGVQAASRYIDSSKRYDTVRISGLETGKTYALTVSALKYADGGAGTVALDRALKFAQPQSESDPFRYTFTTGESVVGALSLSSVSQLYSGDEGGSVTSLGLLRAEDFYMGVWRNTSKVHYGSEAAQAEYLERVQTLEPSEELRELAVQNLFPVSDYSADPAVQNTLRDSWTSRFLPVRPGEQYVIYNSLSAGYFRVNFFYRDTDGTLKYYGVYTNGHYLDGGVFSIPSYSKEGLAQTNSVRADQICYMQISGYSQRSCSGLVLEKYDPARAAGANLAAGAGIQEGMTLSSTNTLSFQNSAAFINDYLPVEGGSVYELRNRDPNLKDEKAQGGANTSESYVLFYGGDYTFLGSYPVCNQTALVKAPFGAAFCRFNMVMDQSADPQAPAPSLKLYRGAIPDQYLAAMELRLQDGSESQILTGGSYSVTLYTSLGSVSDADDLTELTYTQLGEALTSQVTEADLTDGRLNIVRRLEFADLNPNMAFQAVLRIRPAGWADTEITLSTIYFTTNRVVRTVSNLAELMAMQNDPAGSYIVTADIPDLNTQVLNAARPFTGTIDFQGHTVTTSSFNALFYRISGSGVVKNLVINYNALDTASTTPKTDQGAVCSRNYGTIQNVVVRYRPDNQNAGLDVQYGGGIARYNYGTIDGFVVELEKDVRVPSYFGGVCQENHGRVSNGYICGAELADGSGQRRTARLVHTWQHNGEVVSTDTSHVSLGVGYNTSRGVIENVFVVGDLVIQSADASSNHANADVKDYDSKTPNPDYETSTTNTASAALLAGSSYGVIQNAFATGDRLDYDPVSGTSNYMLDRGPAVGNVTGLCRAENVTYFSRSPVSYSQLSAGVASVGTYNIRGEYDSLYDYQWYDAVLGADGRRFVIRDQVEAGYYPQLLLPDCFPAGTQPAVPLPNSLGGQVEVLYNEVRLQGVEQALVTVSLDFPYTGSDVTGLTVVDRNHTPIDCTVLAHRTVEDTYRVDVLLSLPENSSALPDSSYTITGVSWTGGRQTFSDTSSARVVNASFWREIDSVEAWKSALTGTSSNLYGNYLLTQDLDFSASADSNDWFCQNFYGTLNGGVYAEARQALTSDAGEPILDGGGAPMTIAVWGGLTGMHTIRGVGNVDASGAWAAKRDGTYRSSLISNLYGTMQNLVFRDFVSVEGTTSKNAVNSAYGGVAATARTGARLENCHVRDSVFYARSYGGGLAGYVSGAALRGCSARNVIVRSFRLNSSTVDTVSLGGLAGYLSGAMAESCFAADVSVLAPDVYESGGVGGLLGFASETTVQDCYATGTVDAGAGRVGGVVGQLAGNSVLTGCWSTASVTTVADYAGGVAGYHAGGRLTNNFTASTLITRSLAADCVHRICSSTVYDESNRRDNYAFQGQYITYFEKKNGSDTGIYQFGVWDDEDGATALLTRDALCERGTWSGLIGVGAGYDLTGGGLTGGASGGTRVTGVEQGYYPKLVDGDSGFLLYDQPDVEIGFVTTSALGRVNIQQDVDLEQFTVDLALFSSREDLLTAPFESLADWEAMGVIGGTVIDSVLTPGGATARVHDMGQYTEGGGDGREGRAFRFTVSYKDQHYLDSYILTLPVHDGLGGTELLQARLSLNRPVYKYIYTIDDWNAFFQEGGSHAAAYENVMVGWAAGGSGVVDFSGQGHVDNVRVNRLDGEKNDSTGAYPTLKNLNVSFSSAGRSLISQAVTSISGLNFSDMELRSVNASGALLGGGNKGVVGLLQGDMSHVTFQNIKVDGGSGNSVGLIGRLYGQIDGVELQNIRITTTGSYVGGLVGSADASSTVKNVTLRAPDGTDGGADWTNSVRSTVGTQVGGLVGQLSGLASGLTVEAVEVCGRAHVGGAIGYSSGNGGRPTEKKVTGVTVGTPRTDGGPGAADHPSVVVKLEADEGATAEMRYCGGALGYGGSQPMEGITVQNAWVGREEKSVSDTVQEGTYSYYIGGVIGSGGDLLQSSTAKNCTVVSYGGWCGGVSGSSVYWYNTAESCVVRGVSERSANVGGVSGAGRVDRSLAQSCVVSGGENVGGAVGSSTSTLHQGGAVDCVVLGRTNVGGLSGLHTYYDLYGSHVTSSETAVTEVTADMLPAWLSGRAGSYHGAAVLGSENVGGLAGSFTGVSMHDNYVGAAAVQGEENVGGLAGEFYGWYAGYYVTTSRSLYNCAMGAEVRGGENVGGAIGRYTASPGAPDSIQSAAGPFPANFRGLLVTGSVSGAGADVLMPGAAKDGTGFAYCRVLGSAAPQGTAAYGGSAPGERAALLSVTAEELTDPNLYFLSRSTYGGMEWSRTYWAGDALQAVYASSGAPASFQTYQSGISRNGLVLWLDAQNNTGKGYTDESAAVWKDLSGQNNNAALYWNNKPEGSSFTIAERGSQMFWNDGALEFTTNNKNYYAQLEKSLSPYLQGGYTVELVYTYSNPAYAGHSQILGWRDGAAVGGFHGPYNASAGAGFYPYALLSYDYAGTSHQYSSISCPETVSTTLRRTAAYVAGAPDGAGRAPLAYRLNGDEIGSSRSAAVSFRNSDTMRWRIGDGVYENAYLRVCGVRVYARELSDLELHQHAQYDEWYYFGGGKPDSAAAASGALTLDENGAVSGGAAPYRLLRSEDGGLRGTLVDSAYTGRGLGSRGYYCVMDSAGNFSNVVQKLAPGYGPRLRSTNLATEYYGSLPYAMVRGQEGQTASGALNDADDGLFFGGYRLADAGVNLRPVNPKTAAASNLLLLQTASALPGVTAYASGADAVNLELLADPPAGLSFSILTEGEEPVLTGDWPRDSRTLTMTWDYLTAFTLRLEWNGETAETRWTYNDLARSVMTRGSGFWYLYGSECYDRDGTSLDPATVFIHMMDGLLLDETGRLYHAEDLSPAGTAVPFTLTDTRPIWSGRVLGAKTASYATYLVSDGGLKATQLVSKGEHAYTMPASRTVPGSFVVDTYGERSYTTVLGVDGILCDMGDPLTYPEDFSNGQIRELSNTLDSDSHIVLVRYHSGALTAFNYLTGETLEVRSQEDDTSFWDYILDQLESLGGNSVLSGGAQQALNAVDYESEVAGDASLQTALANLKNNETNTAVTDGEGSGLNAADLPGGLDGEALPGLDADNGQESAVTEGQTVTEGGAPPEEASPGAADSPADGAGPEPAAPAEPEPQEPDREQTPGKDAEPDREQAPGKDAAADAAAGQGGQTLRDIQTRYVTLYNAETGESAVYDLEELLKEPEEALVTQEARAEQLEEMGFRTTLLTRSAQPTAEASGLLLMAAASGGTIVLLLCMGILKKCKLDRRDDG